MCYKIFFNKYIYIQYKEINICKMIKIMLYNMVDENEI